ncbi:MAG: BMP family protein [Rhodobacterales bacterium]|nr:BMP family protein [Rhodobacterales bacterium]
MGAVIGFSAMAAQAQDEKTLKFAAVFPTGLENAWVKAWIDSFNAVKAEKPHGIELDLAYTENVYGDKSLTVLEEYAESGEYPIIWAHTSYSDEVEELKDRYPDTMFVTVGAGNRPLGGNSYLIYMHLHEPAYLAGILAAGMTKTGKIGVVGLFPADDVNDQINGFRAGVKSVNSDAKVSVTFIESWYDPAKAAEAANAQIAAGADLILQLGESFQTCIERSVLCIGNYIDSSSIAPDVIPTSTMVNWQPHINYVIDEWKKKQDTGEPYAAPEEAVWFTMAQGSGDLAPYHNFEDKIPAEVKEQVNAARAAILDGSLTVELDMSLPASD